MADIKIGISTEGVPKANTELNSVVATGEKVVATNEKIEKSNQKVSNSFKGGAGNIRNSAYQLQDLAVQIQGGTSVTTALSQQLPQLLSGFGLLGVVAGAAAAGLGLLISATDIFSSKSERLVKQQKGFIASLKETVDLIDQFSQGTKLLTTTSADAFEQWLAAFRKANQEGKKELLDFLALQKIINDAAEEAATKEVERIKERRKNLSDLNRQMGLPSTLGFGMPFSPITDAALAEAEIKQKKLQDIQKRTDAALRGDFGTATQGGSAQTSIQTTLQQRLDALKSEAEFIGVSNAQREYGVMLAELEAQAKRSNTTLDQKQIALLKELVYARDAARSTEKIREYTREQEREIDLLKLEGEAVGMTALQHKQLIDARKLEAQLAKDTMGMQPAQAEAYRENARLLFLQKQSLEQVNYEQQRTFGYGAIKALTKYKEEATNIAAQIESSFASAFKGMEDAIISMVQNGKLSFKSLADSIISDLLRISVRQGITAPLANLLGTAIGSSLGSSSVSLGTSALGGNPSASTGFGMNPSAGGFGIKLATGTNYVPYDNFPALLHKGEAVVPAKYNPASGGSTNVVVNNYSSETATTKETMDSRGNRRIEVIVGELVSAEVRRSGSPMNSAMKETFGTSPSLIRR